METRILTQDDPGMAPDDLREVGRTIARGALVAFPTETVYGIAVARGDPGAVERLYELKERDRGKPLTVHLGDASDLDALAAPLSGRALRLVRRLWPGPLTLVIRDSSSRFSGFRLPDHELARELLRAAEVPVVATSANLSGEPALVTGADVVARFSGRVDAIIDAGRTRYAAPSTVVRVRADRIEVLREGVLSARTVRRAAAVRILLVCTGNLCRSPMAAGLLEEELSRRLGVTVPDLPDRGFVVESAGTGAIDGNPPTEAACRAAEALGAQIAAHRSRPLTPSIITGADRIYVAEARHGNVIAEFIPEAGERIGTILPGGADLADPFGGSDKEYRRTARRIAGAIPAIASEVMRLADA